MTIHPSQPGLSITMQFTTPPLESHPIPSTKIEEKRHLLFWFRKENGEVFCTQEEEAWNILRGRIKIFVNGQPTIVKHEYLGCSTSESYFRGLKEMQKIFNAHGLEKAQDYLRELEKKELETADISKKPRNFDRVNQFGVPVDAEGTPLKF